MKRTPKSLFSVRHFFRSFGNILRDSKHSSIPSEIPVLGEYVRLTNQRTKLARVVDNLDSHGWYALWGSGRTSFLSRFTPCKSLDEAMTSATHWSDGKFGTLSRPTKRFTR